MEGQDVEAPEGILPGEGAPPESLARAETPLASELDESEEFLARDLEWEINEVLARAETPLASELDWGSVEPEILTLALKKCKSNYNAWKSLLRDGKGEEATNQRGMDAWREKALAIANRLQQLQQRA